MSQTTAIILAFIMYVLFPVITIFAAYKGYKYFKKSQKTIEYNAVPRLWHVPESELPPVIANRLKALKDKGENLRLIYGDTNKDGVIDEKDMMSETYSIISKILEKDLPQALKDYQALTTIDKNIAQETKILNSELTAQEALTDIIDTIDEQFEELLTASYQQDAQKLLVTNRYLQQRFDQRSS